MIINKKKNKENKNFFKKLLLLLKVGCGFNTVGNLARRNGYKSWQEYLDIVNEDWQIIYLNSLYFSIITICTVGYGKDINSILYNSIYYNFFKESYKNKKNKKNNIYKKKFLSRRYSPF